MIVKSLGQAQSPAQEVVARPVAHLVRVACPAPTLTQGSQSDVDVEGPDDVKPAKVGHSDSASSQESHSDSHTATKSRQNHFYTDRQLAKVTSLFHVSTISVGGTE